MSGAMGWDEERVSPTSKVLGVQRRLSITGHDSKVSFIVQQDGAVEIRVQDPGTDDGDDYGFSATVTVEQLGEVADELRRENRDRQSRRLIGE